MLPERSFVIATLICAGMSQIQPALPFESYNPDYKPPASWSGPIFKLSEDYPKTKVVESSYPWKSFDFKTQPKEYLQAVYDYCLEGNLEAKWVVQDNQKRKWYHAPWLHHGPKGREFVHGMTRERSSEPFELHQNQNRKLQNWAVSFYNPTGAYTLHQVWADPDKPNTKNVKFEDGAVACKLLFSEASPTEVPYLDRSETWDAHVLEDITSSTSKRKIRPMRLLQIDVAIRDTRTDDTTGWVFGTFIYDSSAPGDTPWKRMVPVGLMWGNDPTLNQTAFDSGKKTQESVILNDKVQNHQLKLGYLRRLNGPVDNPISSCISCHSTSQFEMITPMTPSDPAKTMDWFQNIRAGVPFDNRAESVDYSLQLAIGLQNFSEAKPDTMTILGKPTSFSKKRKDPLPIYEVDRDGKPRIINQKLIQYVNSIKDKKNK